MEATKMKRILLALCAIALVAAMRMTLATPPLVTAADPPSLIGLWHFDEGSGYTAADSSGYGNDATLHCGADFALGVSGTALTLNLDGDSPQHMGSVAVIPYSDSLNITGPYTFEAYLKIKDLLDVPNKYRPIFLNGPGSIGATDQPHSIEIYVKGNEALVVGHNRRTAGTFGQVSFPCPPINAPDFFHLVISFDGTNVRAYYNGIEQGAIGGNSAIPVPSGSALGWWIGRLLDTELSNSTPEHPYNQSYFSGMIDELHIWNASAPIVHITAPANDVYAVGTVPALQYTIDGPYSTVYADPIDQTPGIHTVTVTAYYVAGLTGSSSVSYVVYDPTGGFVTGGGWFMSPQGAYTPLYNPEYVDSGGKATFGFVSKYQKGATVPTGNTEFQFQAGNLFFKSTLYEWLVVNQNGTNAQFKGYGTINGSGSFRFMLWAGDNSLSGDPDSFRIKIWQDDGIGNETVVYDNGSSQPIDGGSIVVHTKK
jgi:hypothetical protein